jgi:UDP-glucose 4-epimerase
VRAIVTGGAGFIGSNLVDALVAEGHEAHALDDLSKGRRENVSAPTELHVADIREPDAVFDSVRPEIVFHLAAQADVRVSVEKPAVDADVNILGTIRILEAARRHGAKVVFASSGGAAYGECDGPAPESAPLRPLAPYGTSKVCGEEYLATWNRLYGTAHVSLRLGNVYGPRQVSHGEAGVVAIFMGLLRDGGTPTIFGDGRQTRDFTFVRDIVDATCRAAEAPTPAGEVVNVAGGSRVELGAVIGELERLTGRTARLESATGAPGEMPHTYADIRRASDLLGWSPKTSLAEGLHEEIAWIDAAEASGLLDA